MQLTVLGRWSPFPAPGEACSGYLLEHGGQRILLECGNGVLGKLALHVNVGEIDAVVLSHLHADHCADALILRYAIAALQRMGRREEPMRIYAPDQPSDEFARLSYKEAVEAIAISPGEERRMGDFTFEFFPAQHQLPTLCMRISAGGRTLAYTADSGLCTALQMAAKDADVLLSEASLRDEDDDELQQGHLTGGQAGALAATAGVRRLLLTHLFPLFDARQRKEEAQRQFRGLVEVVRSGATYQV